MATISENPFETIRVLNGPYEGTPTGSPSVRKFDGFGFGANRDSMAGVPHFDDVTFIGRFPVAELEFHQANFPGQVRMTAFSPFIPHNAVSSLSIIALRFDVRQADSVSDHARCALELTPRIAEPGNQLARPLISLIVPVWNDEERVVNLVSGLRVTPELAEWVVAGVRPGPILCELNRHGIVRLISCDEPSRGRQMNAGAAEARGSLLCFHHADSELRPEHLKALEQTARNDAILGGAFYRRFDDRRASIVLWEGLIRRINSFAGPLFGDQSIFVRASVFERLGGFPDIPLMEDIEFSRRLRRLGRTVLLDPPLWSSPRRFRHLGNWRTTLLNLTFVGLFYLGVDPNTLHRWYYRSFRG